MKKKLVEPYQKRIRNDDPSLDPDLDKRIERAYAPYLKEIQRREKAAKQAREKALEELAAKGIEGAKHAQHIRSIEKKIEGQKAHLEKHPDDLKAKNQLKKMEAKLWREERKGDGPPPMGSKRHQLLRDLAATDRKIRERKENA